MKKPRGTYCKDLAIVTNSDDEQSLLVLSTYQPNEGKQAEALLAQHFRHYIKWISGFKSSQEEAEHDD